MNESKSGNENESIFHVPSWPFFAHDQVEGALRRAEGQTEEGGLAFSAAQISAVLEEEKESFGNPDLTWTGLNSSLGLTVAQKFDNIFPGELSN